MKIILTILALLVLPLTSFAISSSEEDQYIYLFHLYYDNGQLVADRDYEIKYDIVAEAFIPETSTTQFPYKGEVINFANQIVSTFQFDPRQGNTNLVRGKVSIKAPYFADAQKVIFYNFQDQAVLTVFVSESSFCNDDGVCNDSVGEDTKNCPLDCKEATPVPTVTTEPPESGQGSIWKSLIYVLIGGVIVGFWYGWKWYKRRQEPPLIQLPQDLNVQ